MIETTNVFKEVPKGVKSLSTGSYGYTFIRIFNKAAKHERVYGYRECHMHLTA